MTNSHHYRQKFEGKVIGLMLYFMITIIFSVVVERHDEKVHHCENYRLLSPQYPRYPQGACGRQAQDPKTSGLSIRWWNNVYGGYSFKLHLGLSRRICLIDRRAQKPWLSLLQLIIVNETFLLFSLNISTKFRLKKSIERQGGHLIRFLPALGSSSLYFFQHLFSFLRLVLFAN